jgi:DNA-binding response OmpR family regulator
MFWDKRQISWQQGSLSLTPTEARLLRALFDRKNEMVPHTELVFLIQGYQIETEEAAKILRPVVSRLRQKMGEVPGWGDRIKNVRGAGYVLELN